MTAGIEQRVGYDGVGLSERTGRSARRCGCRKVLQEKLGGEDEQGKQKSGV